MSPLTVPAFDKIARDLRPVGFVALDNDEAADQFHAGPTMRHHLQPVLPAEIEVGFPATNRRSGVRGKYRVKYRC